VIATGQYEFGPKNGRLLVKTFREGLAKKVGHDLVIEITDWKANVSVDGDPSRTAITGSAQIASLQVLEGNGGVMPLSDGDKADIKETIMGKVLPMAEVRFRSTGLRANGNRATVSGELTIGTVTQPIDLELTQDGSRVTGTMTVVQTRWGIKPHTAMLGALKVRDAVDIELEAAVPQA
jgi:polyisoprenoid-binding protein YceI